MGNESFIRLNTALKPPADIAAKAIEMSREIGRAHKAFFILDGVQSHPHITIYPPEYPESNILDVLRTVAEVASQTKKLALTFTNINHSQGWIGVYFERSSELMTFHETIVRTLGPFRKADQSGKDYPMNFSPAQLANIQKYGYPDAMELYAPHLTIIRLQDPIEAQNVAQSLQCPIESFVVDTIGIYKTGEHGTCVELLKEFSLQ